MAALLTLLVLAAPGSAAAATNTFQGPGNQWNAGANWSQSSVPDATDDVVIPSTRNVVLDTTAGVGNSLDLAGSLQVNGTSLTLGAGTSLIGGALDLTGGATVNLGTTTTWSAGSINFNSGGGTLHVGAGDVLNVTGANLASLNFQGGLWRNDGTVNRTTSATTAQIGVPFENDGAVNVAVGTLNLGQGTGAGSSSGDYVAASGAELLFAGGNHQVAGAGARVGGAGSVRVTLDALTVAADATFDPAALTIAGGTLALSPDSTVTSLTATSGTRSGAGRLTVSGVASLGGLNLSGGATTDLTGTAQITGGLDLTGGHTLELPPAATWSAGSINFNSGGGTLHVGAGDVLNVTGANLASLNFQGGLWRNDGTVNRTTSATTAQIGVPFENTGTIDVDTGTLAMDQGLTQTDGVSDVASGATLGGSLSLQGGTLRGAGTAGGNVTNSGATVRPGSSPGKLSIGGNYTQGPGGTLEVEVDGPAQDTQYDHLAVGGTATLGGTLAIQTEPGFDPALSDTFQVVTAGSRTGTFANVTGAQVGGKSYAVDYNPTDVTLRVALDPPANTSPPAISGTAVEGETLTCDPGTWSGSPAFAFEWLRDGTPIGGATARTYTPTADDIGKAIRCRVTATNSAGSAQATSAAVTPTARPPAPRPEPEPQPQVPAAPPAAPLAPAPAPCSDKVRPTTTLGKRGIRRGTRTLTLSGVSSDAGACSSGVQRVQVSLAQVAGRSGVNCRFVKTPNRFALTRPQNCRKPILFTARGTDTWSFVFNLKLKPGKYRVQVRAIDRSGNKESPKAGRSIVLFTVR